jgi:predicted O-linked N-acetylglucosamine transferase (SPINDLY family)
LVSRGALGTQASAVQLQQALSLVHAGRPLQASALLHEVLRREPRNFNALQLQGHIALQAADYAAAERWLSAARAVNASSALVLSNLSVALLALQRPAEALQCCDRAIELKPHYPEALCNRGHACCALHRPEEGIASYDEAIALSPAFYDAHAGRVKALLALRRYAEALAGCERAIALNAHNADAWCQRGAVLLRLKRPAEALAAFDRALSLAPDSAEVHNNRGTALRTLKRPQEALAAYQRALALRPQFVEVYCNVANIALDAGRYEEALTLCERALSMRPDSLDALNIRGTTLRGLRRYEDAAAVYQQILAQDPHFGQALSHLLVSRAHVCNWSGRDEQSSRVIERIAAGESASAPHPFLWICDSAPLQLACARLYTESEFPQAPPLWQGERYRHERLRIAYLSADFADHPVAHLIAGVLERHDRERFETFGISLCQDPTHGPMHQRMRRAFEHFYDASADVDADVAARLRGAEIDIAIDLTGHTRGGRLGILARRPSPIQINFLGFTGTCGAGYVDYLIGDGVAIPEGQDEHFSEHIIRMPHAFLPNDDAQAVAAQTPRRSDLGLPAGAMVFCAFNNTYKINPAMFDVWMRLLQETPGSVLWLRAGEGAARANLSREAVARGVDADRLVFASRMDSMDGHLARYRQADLFLDTLPYGAHATSRDALWAGLPVLTCTGGAFATRVAASLLTGLGLPELVTRTLDEYAERALDLAHSPDRLAELRGKLAQQRMTSPVFRTDLYRRHLESAYAALCEREWRGEPKTALTVPSLD